MPTSCRTLEESNSGPGHLLSIFSHVYQPKCCHSVFPCAELNCLWTAFLLLILPATRAWKFNLLETKIYGVTVWIFEVSVFECCLSSRKFHTSWVHVLWQCCKSAFFLRVTIVKYAASICFSCFKSACQKPTVCESYSESNASYFMMLACDIRGGCWWYGSRTFPPISHCILLLCDRWQQSGSLTERYMEVYLEQKCVFEFLYGEKMAPADIQ